MPNRPTLSHKHNTKTRGECLWFVTLEIYVLTVLLWVQLFGVWSSGSGHELLSIMRATSAVYFTNRVTKKYHVLHNLTLTYSSISVFRPEPNEVSIDRSSKPHIVGL